MGRVMNAKLPWLGKLIELLGPSGGQNTAFLSVDGQWLRLLYARGRWGSREVAGVLTLPVQGLSHEDIVARLKDLCNQQGWVPETVLVANPSHLTTARLFTLPSSNPAEIRDIIELQAEKHTPYAKEEILTDFIVVETDPSGYSRVMLIISHQDVVYRALRIVKGMGWALERVGFELDGLCGWARALPDSPLQKSAVVLVVDLDADSTTLVILKQGKAYFHRNLSTGTAQLAEHAELLPKLVAEIVRSIESFEGEGLNLPIEHVLIAGQTSHAGTLPTALGQQLKMPVTTVSSAQRWSLSDAVRSQITALPVSCTSLLGLTAYPGEIDLTPAALRLHRTFEVRARALVGIGCQVIFAVILLLVLLIGHAQKAERYHAFLVREHRQTSQAAEALEMSLVQIGLVSDWLKTRSQMLDAVAELNRVAPASVRWNAFSFIGEGKVSVKGVSDQMPRVYDYVSAIERSALFEQVEAKRVSKRKDGEAYVTEFEITAVLETVSDDQESESSGGEG